MESRIDQDGRIKAQEVSNQAITVQDVSENSPIRVGGKACRRVRSRQAMEDQDG